MCTEAFVVDGEIDMVMMDAFTGRRWWRNVVEATVEIGVG